MRALRIDWTETEGGCEQRSDGFSLHASPEAATTYLTGIFGNLPKIFIEYQDYPGKGWKNPVFATPVEIPDGTTLAEDLVKNGSVRRAGYSRENYRIKSIGEPVQIEHSPTSM